MDGLGMVNIDDAVAYWAVGLGEVKIARFAFQAALFLQYVFLLGLDQGAAAFSNPMKAGEHLAFCRFCDAEFIVASQQMGSGG